MSTTIQTALPAELLAKAEEFVRDGGASDLDSLMAESLRCFLDSRSTALTEEFAREDVQWGLSGDE